MELRKLNAIEPTAFSYTCYKIWALLSASENSYLRRAILFSDSVELDICSCTTTLPHDKLVDCHSLVSSFLRKCRARKNQLQRLEGKLKWTCRVVYGGRTFLRRVIDTIDSQSPHAKNRLTPSLLDLRPTADVMTDSLFYLFLKKYAAIALYSHTGCSFDGNFENFRRNIGILIDSLSRASCSVHFVPGGRGVFPLMFYTRRLHPKGVPFSGFRYIKE